MLMLNVLVVLLRFSLSGAGGWGSTQEGHAHPRTVDSAADEVSTDQGRGVAGERGREESK